MERRKFTREFKLEAVRRIKDRGVSYVQASQDLGVHTSHLRDWVKKLADDPQHAFPGQLLGLHLPLAAPLLKARSGVKGVRRTHAFMFAAANIPTVCSQTMITMIRAETPECSCLTWRSLCTASQVPRSSTGSLGHWWWIGKGGSSGTTLNQVYWPAPRCQYRPT